MPLAASRLAVALTVLLVSAPAAAQTPPASNPFFEEWTTPFGMPPFDRIKAEHYMPAFEAGIAERKKEVEAIASNPAAPTFANTVEALENGGLALAKVSDVFFTLTGAETNDALQAINKEIAPKLSALRDDVLLNEKLFARVKAVWETREKLTLSVEQRKLLEETYKDFVRGGANLAPEQKKRFREINQELSVLGLKFADNLLKETNGFKLVIDRKEDLAGLPPALVSAAADAAKAAKLEGKWVFTPQAPSIFPFLTFAENRDLRKKILDGYTSRGDHGDALDNKATLSRIAALRSERARLLGYKTHADFVLEENMAKTPAGVYGLLNRIWPASLGAGEEGSGRPAGRDQGRRQGLRARGVGLALLHREGPEGALRPRRPGAPPLLPARPGARGRLLRGEPALRPHLHRADRRAEVPPRGPRLRGEGRRRLVPRPLHGRLPPAPRQAERRLVRPDPRGVGPGRQGRPPDRHERHQLHAPRRRRARPPLARGGPDALPRVRPRAERLRLTRHVPLDGPHARDFVELPSQIMENWALEPEVLKVYAKHWKTGEVIPVALVEKIEKAGTFGEGFRTTEYLAASFLDMDWHTLPDAEGDGRDGLREGVARRRSA